VKLSLTLLGRTLGGLSASLSSDGKVTLDLAAAGGFSFGPFTLTPGASSSASFTIGDPTSPRISLKNMSVSLPGDWSCGLVTKSFGPKSGLSFQPPDVNVGGMSFGSAWTLSRSDGHAAATAGQMTAGSSDAITAYGCSLTRSMSIDSSGKLSGSLTGRLEITIDPPPTFFGDPPPYTTDFGEVTIDFDASSKKFTHQFTGFNFSWP
jgi:hypothetical protein